MSVERSHPPRALHCEFPLGRPLGRPGDAAFQRRVLVAALRLLERSGTAATEIQTPWPGPARLARWRPRSAAGR